MSARRRGMIFMKAAVYYSNDKVLTQEVEAPDIGDGEILVKVKSCGICIADTMEWYQKPKAPIILGHEATGVVEKTGSGVKDFSVGSRVFVHHHVPCMKCEYCRKQNYTLCKTFKTTNYRPGGFCEYIAVSPLHVDTDTLLLPDNVSFEEGTLIEPLACVVHAVRRTGVKPSDRTVIIGAGSIGVMFAQVLKAYGVRDMLIYETNDWRAKKAEEIAGVKAIKPSADSAESMEEYKKLTGFDGADKVFVVAKDLGAMSMGLELAHGGATVMLFATPADDEYLPFYVSKAFFKELTIKLSYSADHLDTREALALIAAGKIDVSRLITHRFSLDEVSKGILQAAGRGEALKCVVNIP